jgi:hypothetical protein
MSWSWSRPARGDAWAIILLIALVAVFALAAVKYTGWGRATGFGPEWDCRDVGSGDPVCVKKPAATPSGPAAPAR